MEFVDQDYNVVGCKKKVISLFLQRGLTINDGVDLNYVFLCWTSNTSTISHAEG